MISRLTGRPVDISMDSITIDVQGVGYEVFCPLGTLAEFQAQAVNPVGAVRSDVKSKEVTVYIHTHVREDAFQLFGFATKEEKRMFLLLLKVSGIGPKSALNILSGASADQVFTMIENEDVKALSKLPKVGKKTAEQMILALKGKLVRIEESSVTGMQKLSNPVHQDIASALVNLGFKSQDVEKIVADLNKEISLQEGIRQGLAALTGG